MKLTPIQQLRKKNLELERSTLESVLKSRFRTLQRPAEIRARLFEINNELLKLKKLEDE